MRNKIKATIRVSDGPAIKLTGREAQTIVALVEAGPKGITSLETFLAGWAVRLGAYIFDLKAMGVPIRATREPHDGGNHARYYLAGPVEIISVSDPNSAPSKGQAT
jgi:Helix-turn-helix domain